MISLKMNNDGDLVWFYGIVGYLMPNPVFTYTRIIK